MNIRKTKIFNQIDRDIRIEVYKYLDFLWDAGAFVPCPMNQVRRKFPGLTFTHILYLILAWHDTQRRKINLCPS